MSLELSDLDGRSPAYYYRESPSWLVDLASDAALFALVAIASSILSLGVLSAVVLGATAAVLRSRKHREVRGEWEERQRRILLEDRNDIDAVDVEQIDEPPAPSIRELTALARSRADQAFKRRRRRLAEVLEP